MSLACLKPLHDQSSYVADVALPDIAPFHSLVALDVNVRSSSNVFGLASWVYKAQSGQDGHYYCLRRIEGEQVCQLQHHLTYLVKDVGYPVIPELSNVSIRGNV